MFDPFRGSHRPYLRKAESLLLGHCFPGRPSTLYFIHTMQKISISMRAKKSDKFAPGTLSSRESKYAVGQLRRYSGIVPECVASRHPAAEGISGTFALGTLFPRADKYAVFHSYHAKSIAFPRHKVRCRPKPPVFGHCPRVFCRSPFSG